MDIFGENYLEIRKKYVIPLIHYGIQRDKYQYWILKDIICEKLISINLDSKNEIIIEIPKDDFYKSIVCEIELYHNKSVIQLYNFIKSSQQSSSWIYVTQYYLLFFCATTLFRFLNCGFTFLNSKNTQKLERFAIAAHSNPIKLNVGNYYFSISGVNEYNNLIIKLVHKSENLHKHTWLQLEKSLRSFSLTSRDDEKIVLSELLSISNKFGYEFHSNLRNKLNYQGESGILDFTKELSFVKINTISDNYSRRLLKYNGDNSVNSQILGSTFILLYILNLNLKLYDEYKNRSQFGKDFQKERDNFLKKHSIGFPILS